MLLVQLGINSTRDVWNFAKLDSPRRLVQFWQNLQTSLIPLIPNCTRQRMITYTYAKGFGGAVARASAFLLAGAPVPRRV